MLLHYLPVIGGAVAVMLAVWLVNVIRKRHGSLRMRHYSFPRQWLGWLENNVPGYSRLPWDLREPLQDYAMSFADGKAWFACGGLETVTDEMKVTIGGCACMLLLNRQGAPDYSRMRNIHVYPASFLAQAPGPDPETDGSEHWPEGAIVLAWDGAKHIARDLRDRFNPALAELLRKLGPPGGPADSATDFQFTPWARVICPSFVKAMTDESGRVPLAEKYGTFDPLSFLAVATEVFFEAPEHLRLRHAEVYETLRKFYRIDPARWRKAA